MVRKLSPLFLILLLAALACSLPGSIGTGAGTEPPAPPAGGVTPEVGGVTPESGGTTPEDYLPPPAVAPALEVAYAKAGNLWLWTDGAGAAQLTSAGTDASPLLSPDGSQVAFQRGDELWVVHADGSNPHAVITSAFLAGVVDPSAGRAVIHWFIWRSTFAEIWFGTSTAADPYTTPNYDLYGVPADGSAAPVSMERSGLGGIGTFSPDGNWIALAQPEKIILTQLDGSNYHEALTFDLVQTYSEWFYVPEVVWFADSSEFRTVIPAHDALGNPLEGTYFWSVPVSGSPVDMAGFTAVPAFQNVPRVSPNGLNVAYMAPNGSDSELHLNGFYIGDELYSTYPAGQWGLVSWAPDSGGFVYWIDDVRSLWFGYIGSAAVPLTDTLHSAELRWIDISRILFVSDGDLRLGVPGGASSLVDSGVDGGYDYFNPLP